MKDKTYCINADCPFIECDKHLHQLKNEDGYVNVAAFDSVCRDYIGYLIDDELYLKRILWGVDMGIRYFCDRCEKEFKF